jgi:hypothetical protein
MSGPSSTRHIINKAELMAVCLNDIRDREITTRDIFEIMDGLKLKLKDDRGHPTQTQVAMALIDGVWG